MTVTFTTFAILQCDIFKILDMVYNFSKSPSAMTESGHESNLQSSWTPLISTKKGVVHLEGQTSVLNPIMDVCLGESLGRMLQFTLR